MSYVTTPSEIRELRAITGAGLLDCRNALEKTYGFQDLAARYIAKRGTYHERSILIEAMERRDALVPYKDYEFNHHMSVAQSMFLCVAGTRERSQASWALLEGTKNLNYALRRLRDPDMVQFVRTCYTLICEEFERVIRRDFPDEADYYIDLHSVLRDHP